MSYKPVSVPSFGGGLVLTAQPDVLDPSQALDLLNVVFSERGAVRQRDGYAKLTSTALTNQPDSISPYITSGGTKRLVVGNGNRLDVFTSFPGATAANSTAPTAHPHFFARFGSPTGERLYISNGTDQVRKLDATTFSTPAGLSGETGKFVAVWQNRLVTACESGTTAGNNPSSVRFSDPADPENFTANVYEDLHPGDGEAIQGMVVWRDQLIVFKQTWFAVFYGIGTDDAGEADPAWRSVEAGVGLAASKAVVSARDGVYFLDRKGVYKTTGSEPQQMSQALDPFFLGNPSIYFRSNTLNKSQISLSAMGFHEERIYLAVPTGTATANDRMLVFDPRYGWWSLYDLPVADMCVFRPSNDEELVFAVSDTTVGKHVGRHSPSYTADNMATDATGGTAITSRWRSGWQDFGDTATKTVRETKLWGEGVVGVQLSVDFRDVGSVTTADFGSSDTAAWSDASWSDALWHFSGQIAPYLVRQARRGTTFSMSFSNATLNQSWAIHRAANHLRDFRTPSTTQTEVVASG
jgi:hypothetical protein